MEQLSTTMAGWYGKLPALGDFVGRGLPDGFVRPWDDWLAQSLLHIKREYGAQADDVLLTFPVWRFVLPRRLLTDQAWLGALIPSVDRVGRCFPLTVALPLPEQYGAITAQHALPVLTSLHLHVDALVKAALTVLDNDDLEAFGASVAAASQQPWDSQVGPMPEKSVTLMQLLSDIGSRLASSHLAGETLWWTGELNETPGVQTPARLFRWPGRLDDALFARLLEN